MSELLSDLTNDSPNWYVNNIYSYIECISIILIYYVVSPGRRNLIFLSVLAAAYTVFFILDGFIFGNLNKAAAVLMTSEAMLIIVLSIRFFFRLISSSDVSELTDDYIFWLNTAFLVYFSGSLIVFLFINYILRLNPTDTMRGLWMVHLFFNIVYNILLAKSIYTWKKNRA